MAEAEHAVPSIRIHVDQQVTIETVRGQEDLEDATVATEITGFDVEDDAYVLKGALTFSGFLRQGEEGSEELPDALDDEDVFATEDLPEDAPILPLHHRLPFVLQVPVAAQLEHQRRDGILDVNPKVGQWNVHVLGDQTVHLRAELVVQGLSASEGYVFRCGTQEEGVAAQQLDALLDQEEERAALPPQELPGVEFEPPFDQVAETSAWTIEEARHEEAEDAAESDDDWIIESAPDDAQAAEARDSDVFAAEAIPDEEAEDEIVFTPDPNLVFPLPEPGSLWAQQLKGTEAEHRSAADFDQPLAGQPEFVIPQSYQPTTYQPPRYDLPNFEPPKFELPELNVPQPQSFEQAEPEMTYGTPYVADEAEQARPEEVYAEEQATDEDEDAFVLESPEWQETRHEAAEDAEELLIGRTEAYEVEERQHVDEVVEAALAPVAEAHEVERPAADEEQEAERPAVAEFEFEDEVISEAGDDLDVQVIESPVAAKPSGPKLSVGGKSAVVEDAPIKLSALLGDSRARAEAPPAPEQAMEQAPPAPPAPQAEMQTQEQVMIVEEQVQVEVTEVKLSDLAHHKESSSHHKHHESSSSHHHHHDHDHDHDQESASVYTGQKGNMKQTDSIWSDMLLVESGEKATMKFKIVHPEDNIHDLAEKYRTSVQDLLRANNLQDQTLEEGQVLYIPELNR